MRVFIWTGLEGCPAGIAMAAARDEDEARAALLAERSLSMADQLNITGHRALEYDLADFRVFI